jgi:hypothetical protein
MYGQNYPNNKLSAEDAFSEVLKYLWLTQKHEHDLKTRPDDNRLPDECIMLRSMKEIDDMWHEFILFTEDYTEFCQRYFGKYLHHLPNIIDNLPRTNQELTDNIQKLLPYICDHLGESTLITWFESYIERPVIGA